MEHKTTYSQYIQDLSRKIQLYQKVGGSLYVPTKKNPFYDRIRQARRLAESEGIEDVSFEKIYADCGVKFDRDFEKFKEFTDGLSQVADQDGYVDEIKNNKPTQLQTRLRGYLSTHAQQAGISPGEYLVLMTDYRYKNMVIRGDYVAALQEELTATFPNGVVKGLKQNHPDKYYKLEHFIKYSPEPISYDDALEFFGLTNGNSRPTPKGTSPEELQAQDERALETLSTLFPDGIIKNLATIDKHTYFDVIRAARRHDSTPKQWAEQNGFDYPDAADVARFSRITVDAKAHEQKLLALREEFLKDYDTAHADKVDMFHINFEIACKVGKVLYGEQTQDDMAEQSSTTQPTAEQTDIISSQPVQSEPILIKPQPTLPTDQPINQLNVQPNDTTEFLK